MNKQIISLGFLFLFLILMTIQITIAQDFDEKLSDEDKEKFDKMLEPVMKIYQLIKYVATVIAVVILLFAGITYMTSGSDPMKRDKAKNMAMYVVIGLIVIWAAPLVVKYVIG